MSGYYTVDSSRHISSANQNSYMVGANHPDRIMMEHDFVYIIEGSWQIYQNDIAFELHADDAILLHAGQHHYGLQPCLAHTKTMYIHVNCDRRDHFGNIDFTPEDRSIIKIDTVIHCHNNPEIKKLFKEIITVYWSEISIKETKLSILFQLLLCRLHECKDEKAFIEMDIVEKSTQIIHSSPQVFFTAKELSEQLFVSERTLRNKFFKLYNQTLYRYQLETKLQKACLLLKDYPKMKLCEISANLGFYDEFHFSRLFKKKYGVSPNQYKKQN